MSYNLLSEFERRWENAPGLMAIHFCLRETIKRLAALENAPSAPGQAIEPPDITVSLLQQPGEDDIAYTQRVYRALKEHLAEQQSAPPAVTPPPAGSLVEVVMDAIVDGMVESDMTAARAAIRAVADWLDNVGNNESASELRKEASQ